MEKKFHCFLTHDWGIDEENRSNHDRVVKIFHILRERAIFPWIDETELTGDVDDQMCEGIDLSSCVVVFITKRYHEKVNRGDDHDNCRKEFKYSVSRKGAALMIPVIMEKRMKDTSLWDGIIQMYLGKILYVDMSSDDPNDMKNSIEHLIKEIINRVPSIIQQQRLRSTSELKQEQLRQKQLRQEQLRQEQLIQEQEQFRQEQLRQEQFRQEQLRQEQQRLGQEQSKQNTTQKLHICMLVDESSSMRGKRTNTVSFLLKQMGQQFAGDCKFTLILFNTRIRTILENSDTMQESDINRIQPSPGTKIQSSLLYTFNVLQKDFLCTNTLFIVITDAEDYVDEQELQNAFRKVKEEHQSKSTLNCFYNYFIQIGKTNSRTNQETVETLKRLFVNYHWYADENLDVNKFFNEISQLKNSLSRNSEQSKKIINAQIEIQSYELYAKENLPTFYQDLNEQKKVVYDITQSMKRQEEIEKKITVLDGDVKKIGDSDMKTVERKLIEIKEFEEKYKQEEKSINENLEKGEILQTKNERNLTSFEERIEQFQAKLVDFNTMINDLLRRYVRRSESIGNNVKQKIIEILLQDRELPEISNEEYILQEEKSYQRSALSLSEQLRYQATGFNDEYEKFRTECFEIVKLNKENVASAKAKLKEVKELLTTVKNTLEAMKLFMEEFN